ATGPFHRGGKRPNLLGHNERVAAERDTYVVMPSAKAASFEVVEPKLTLEVFVDALGTPSLFGGPRQGLQGALLGQRAQRKLRWRALIRWPLDEQPERFALRNRGAVVMTWDNPTRCEPRPQGAACALTPCHFAIALDTESQRQIADARGLPASLVDGP